jgi:hypothetical protein
MGVRGLDEICKSNGQCVKHVGDSASVVSHSNGHESRKRTIRDHYHAQKHPSTNFSLAQISSLRLENKKTPFHMQE